MNADKERMSAREWAERLVEEGLVEIGPSSQIFTSPKDRRTDDYITGRFG